MTKHNGSYISGAPACVNCPWWKLAPGERAEHERTLGECHATPMQWGLVPEQGIGGARLSQVPLPVRTQAGDCCAQHPDERVALQGRINARAIDYALARIADTIGSKAVESLADIQAARDSELLLQVSELLLQVMAKLPQMREQWERGKLRDDDGKFTRAPTLDEARRFAGGRGEPGKTSEPVTPSSESTAQDDEIAARVVAGMREAGVPLIDPEAR